MARKKAGQTLNITMRPKTLDEVIGIEENVSAIRQLVREDKIPRAFLLAGPFGCGKTTLAYLIASAVQAGVDEDCPFVQEVNAANVTGIDHMRDLIHRSQMAPLTGRYGVIILDEAHKLTKPAQEALLKALEEPSSPTIWILCTTDKDKLVEGIRAGRCFTMHVRGLNDQEIALLIERAEERSGHPRDTSTFLHVIKQARVNSPRKILMAFEAFCAGVPPGEAVAGMTAETMPEYWEISFGVVFGKWNEPYTLPWIPDRKFRGVGEQLRLLDDKLKRRASKELCDCDGHDPDVDDEDLQGRPEVAQALRTIVAATLKGQVLKNKRPAKCAEALVLLGNCAGLNAFGMEFSLVVGALYRVHQILKG